MGILDNVLVSSTRSPYNATTGVTSASNTPVLMQQAGHLSALDSPTTWETYRPLPAAALNSQFKLKVDMWVDIKEGDIITSITLLDGVTPWPGVNPLDTWRITYILPSTAGFLAYQMAYLDRVRAGGQY